MQVFFIIGLYFTYSMSVKFGINLKNSSSMSLQREDY